MTVDALKIFTMLLLLPLTVVVARAESVEDYTLTKLNDLVDRYHITSEIQIENGVKGGEGAQLVYTMAISPHNTDKMLLGNNTSGIYRSDNGGAYWEPSSDGILSQCINTVAFDPDDAHIAYAAVATGSNSARRVALGTKIGLYKSTDGGRTWSHKLLLCNERSVGRLIAFGRKNEAGVRPVFTAASNAADYEGDAQGTTGLWRSCDQGETWECIGLEDRSIISIYTDPDLDLLIVASDRGLDVSYDNGETFASANSNLPYQSASAVAVDPENKEHWTIGARVELANGWCGGMLYETYDSGASWSEVNGELYGRYETTYITSLDYAYVDGHETPRLFMAVYRLNPPNRYSDDYGKTFHIPEFKVQETYGLYSEYGGYFTLPFCINPNDSNILFTSMITPYKSVDGGETFEFSGSGYSGFAVWDYHFDENGAVKYMAVTDVGFARMKPSPGTIYSPSCGISDDIELPSYVTATSSTSLAVDPNDENHGFATMGGYVYGTPATLLETNDGFRTLKPIEGFERLNAGQQKTVSKVMYHPQKSNILYTDFYISEDNGVSWRETAHPISGISPVNGDTLYSLDQYSSYKIYISYDRGVSWEDTGLSVEDNGGKYSAFCVDHFYEDVIWAGDYSTLYRIDIAKKKIDIYDGGRTKFIGLTGNRLELTAMLQNPRLKNHLLLSARDLNGGGSFVYESFDYGVNWDRLECIPYLAHVNPVKFHPTENVVFFSGMMGTLIYKWDQGKWSLNGDVKPGSYDGTTGTYTLSGNAGSGYFNGPVTLALSDSNGNSEVYFTTADSDGGFAFVIEGIAQYSGDYTAKVAIIDNDAFFTDTFSTGEKAASDVHVTAIYHPGSKNFVVYGSAAYAERVSFMLKDRGYAASDITEDNFLDAVRYVTEITPDDDGEFVYKFRFEIPEGKSPDDYHVRILAGEAACKDIPVKVVPEKEYDFEITAYSKNASGAHEIDFTPGAEFKIDVKWRYFLENTLDTQIFAALFDSRGDLIKVFMGQKTMDYDASSDSIAGVMPEGCAELKVFLWSDLRPLGCVKRYT